MSPLVGHDQAGRPAGPAAEAGGATRRGGAGSRASLFAGAVAGPFYVVVSLIEVATREGFDPTRHAWSQLANGDLGWIHSTNLIVSGLLVVAGALALPGRWPTVLLALYGAGLVGAGLFRADPGRGFPVGTPEVVPISTHGGLHFALGALGFVGLVGACLVLARRWRAAGSGRLALYSASTGVLFLVCFVAMAATGGASWALLAFTATMINASAWLSVVFLKGLRCAI